MAERQCPRDPRCRKRDDGHRPRQSLAARDPDGQGSQREGCRQCVKRIEVGRVDRQPRDDCGESMAQAQRHQRGEDTPEGQDPDREEPRNHLEWTVGRSQADRRCQAGG